MRSLGLESEKFAFLTSSRDADTAGQETTLRTAGPGKKGARENIKKI